MQASKAEINKKEPKSAMLNNSASNIRRDEALKPVEIPYRGGSLRTN